MLFLRDNPSPSEIHFMIWRVENNHRSDTAWLQFLSSPKWEMESIGKQKMIDYFNKHFVNINRRLRHFFQHRPYNADGDERVQSFNKEFQLIQDDSAPLMMNVGFNQRKIIPKKYRATVNFSLLTRYLVLNEVTGAVHQFRFLLEPITNVPFYPRVPQEKLMLRDKAQFVKLTEGVLCAGDREDTVRYIQWYIRYAYFSLGETRKKLASLYSDLCVMHQFWEQGFNRQETKVICLEIWQKLLFDQQVQHLLADIRKLKKVVPPHVLTMVQEGLMFNEETHNRDNGHIRMLFIDVLTRRFLLRANAVMTLVKHGRSCNADTLLEIMTMEFE
jgi:hypothetical protein